MTAAQFSDDAYNKRLVGSAAGTLVGNWCEERVLREATGEGRTAPQRHIPRSGLLKDFTKVPPSGGPRDNTFERVCGPKVYHPHMPSSTLVGDFRQAVVAKVGPRLLQREAEKEALVADAVALDDDDFHAAGAERRFDTTTGTAFAKPNESLAERASHLHKSCKNTLWRGPTPDRMRAMGNPGLEAPVHAHYSNVEQVTHARMCLGDPTLRSDLRASASLGVTAFSRCSEFSQPVVEYTRGLAKDEVVDNTFKSLKGTQPLRQLGGSAPCQKRFGLVPSLASVKTAIHETIEQVWGPHGYMMLRSRLFESSDHEGFVHKRDVSAILRNQLGLPKDLVSDQELNVYLAQLCTMKKEEMRVGAFMTSQRPAPDQKDKRRILEVFRSLDPVDGSVQLGAWLSCVHDAELRQVVAGAFGAEDEESAAATPMSESVFVELISDLAALMDVNALLV